MGIPDKFCPGKNLSPKSFYKNEGFLKAVRNSIFPTVSRAFGEWKKKKEKSNIYGKTFVDFVFVYCARNVDDALFFFAIEFM